MSGRNRKDLMRSKQANDQVSRPNSANASGQSTPDRRSSSQPTVDTHFGDQPTPDLRPSDEPTPDELRITAPNRGRQRIPVPRSSALASRPIDRPTVKPSLGLQSTPASSREPTPNLRRTTVPYRSGLRTPVPSSSGAPIPRSSDRPTVNLHSGVQPTPLPRSSGQNTTRLRPITDPHRGGQRTEVPRSSGQLTPVPRSSGRPTVNSPFGLQSNPHPSTSGKRTPSQQHITDPYPDGQRVLEFNSSGQSIDNGIYTITNVHHKRFVYLEDPNDTTPLRGHYDSENRSTRWQVKQWVDGEYSIENVDHSRYANCESRPRLEAFVEGHHDRRLWRIRESLIGGQYTIAAIENGSLWKLPDSGEDTPVSFSKVPTDPMCQWTFKSAEIVAPVNENPGARSVVPYTELALAPSGYQPAPDAVIVEFTSVIARAPDLLPPLRAACAALSAVLQGAKSIAYVNEDREVLIKRLKFHLATVENDITKLEEDQKIDETIPALNQAVRESLDTYARELEEIYKLLFDNQAESSLLVSSMTSFGHNIGTITDKTLKIDEAFQGYTTALHQFAAGTVTQMQQQLSRFGQESQQGAHTAAEKARPNRPNAYGIQHRECLQGTRTNTLPAISDWFDDENTEKWIFFFLDVAGSGKSTVAKHMAEKWEREERLLARFFFSRDTTETMSTNLFCSTVAGAFSALDAKYKAHMDKFMKLPNVELLSFEKRFEGLVVGPLKEIGRRAILIIDALDECHTEQRDQMLETLRTHHSSIPLLRVFVTGRPERDIKRWANDEFGFGYTNFILLEKSDKDVELYIRHTLKDLPIIQDRLYPVIHRAEGLFIWARVACELLLDCDDIDVLLEELGKEVSLDYLYKVALQQSMPKEGASRRAMVVVLQMILAAKEPLSIAELEILSPKPGVVERVVTRLGSVLLYQGREDPIRLLHATFREFLTTRSKADIFFIQLELGHHTLASGCLTTISYRAQQDVSTPRDLDAISKRKEVLLEQDTH